MFYTIYKTTNQINNKYYIGKHQTNNLDDGYMGSGKLLKRAIAKYGLENFKKEILHVFDNEIEMNAKEKELVVVNESTYNLNEGGHGGFSYINRTINLTERNKKINANRNYEDPKFKENLSNSMKKAMLHSKTPVFTEESSLRRLSGLKYGNSPGAISKKKETYKKTGHSKGDRNSQYGTFWITNGIETKKIKYQDLNAYILLGFRKGRK